MQFPLYIKQCDIIHEVFSSVNSLLALIQKTAFFPTSGKDNTICEGKQSEPGKSTGKVLALCLHGARIAIGFVFGAKHLQCSVFISSCFFAHNPQTQNLLVQR
jgi:hypothetical protein